MQPSPACLLEAVPAADADDVQVEEVKAWDDCTGANLLFLGDNEAWRGTFMGMSWSAFHNVPTLFDQTFGPFNATALAIAGTCLCAGFVHLLLPQSAQAEAAACAGDKVKHLMWRVLNGELPQKHPPKIIVVHVGSNDIAGKLWSRLEKAARQCPPALLAACLPAYCASEHACLQSLHQTCPLCSVAGKQAQNRPCKEARLRAARWQAAGGHLGVVDTLAS